MNDLRFAFWMLLKHRTVTIFAVLALGIGIGANSTIFTMANSLLLSPWPFVHPNRIMRIGEKRVGQPIDNLSLSGLNYLEWKDHCQSFVATGLITMKYFNLTGEAGRPEELAAYVWTPSAKDVFQSPEPLALGRPFLPGDDQPGQEHVVILSHGLWSHDRRSCPSALPWARPAGKSCVRCSPRVCCWHCAAVLSASRWPLWGFSFSRPRCPRCWSTS